jgi:hypothetical protein
MSYFTSYPEFNRSLEKNMDGASLLFQFYNSILFEQLDNIKDFR